MTPAGRFAGFTIQGSPHASGVAIQVSDTVGARFEDIHIYAFDQPGAIGMLFYDDTTWIERTQVSHVSIEYTSTAVQFKVKSKDASFGYNRFSDLGITLETGQTGIDAQGGTFYNTLIVTCNIDVRSTSIFGCLVIGAGANWKNNVYQITGEGPSKPRLVGIHVKAGGHLSGFGLVNIIYGSMQNDNEPSYVPSFRILPGKSPLTTVLDGGSISNFLGTGSSVAVYPQLETYGGYADFGFVSGPNIVSPYVAMYASKPNNSFMIYSYGDHAAPNQMTALARFDGSGNLHTLGAVYTGGADYAEAVKARKDIRVYEPGDVLAVSLSNTRELELSAAPYSTRVAGIYSTNPGVLGGARGVDGDQPNDEVPLAIHGIVPCKVSAENGNISPGDLLVTASMPGCAMKGTRRDAMLGAVVRKAMGKLGGGTGVIPVLVTLQ